MDVMEMMLDVYAGQKVFLEKTCLNISPSFFTNLVSPYLNELNVTTN